MNLDLIRSRRMAAGGLALAAALVVPALACAQTRPPIKTGLWEIQSANELDGQALPDMNARMAKMPPEARQQMEAMMRQRGVQTPAAAPGQTGIRVCLSEESLTGQGWNAPNEGCTHEITSRTAEVWKWRGSCTQPPSTIEGETRFTSATAYTNVMRTTVERKGRTRTMTMNVNAKWLGADCKGLAPAKPR